jgi:hypothetical protein
VTCKRNSCLRRRAARRLACATAQSNSLQAHLIRIKKSARRRLVLEGDTALGLEIKNALDALG